METDNIDTQQPSSSPPKAEDRLSDVEGHAEAPVSNPLRESHAEGDTLTSHPNFLDSLSPSPPDRLTIRGSRERLLSIGRLSFSSLKPNPKGTAPKAPAPPHHHPTPPSLHTVSPSHDKLTSLPPAPCPTTETKKTPQRVLQTTLGAATRKRYVSPRRLFINTLGSSQGTVCLHTQLSLS